MYTDSYSVESPSPEEIQGLRGHAVLEFGTSWCGYCRAAQPAIAEALSRLTDVPHIKVEDGPGRRLGRFFKVKLWPTLIFLRDGEEVARVMRPRDVKEIREAMEGLMTSSN